MDEYIEFLVMEIDSARARACFPSTGESTDWIDWISDEEEDRIAPVRSLEGWTGISACQLPEAELLNYNQLHKLLEALKEMLNAYNCWFVLQTNVPEHIQYKALKDNFDQPVKVKRRHMGFFKFCRPGIEHRKCALGEHCQCEFYELLLSGFEEDNRTPEEQRRAELDIEVRHIKRKYGADWKKYYPYYLDPDFDDDGNPCHHDVSEFVDDGIARRRSFPDSFRDAHSVTVYFQYGRDSLDPLFELEVNLRDAISSEGAGSYDGHEIAVDYSHGCLYMYGLNAELLFRAVESTLRSTDFMAGAIATLRFGGFGTDAPETEIRIE